MTLLQTTLSDNTAIFAEQIFHYLRYSLYWPFIINFVLLAFFVNKNGFAQHISDSHPVKKFFKKWLGWMSEGWRVVLFGVLMAWVYYKLNLIDLLTNVGLCPRVEGLQPDDQAKLTAINLFNSVVFTMVFYALLGKFFYGIIEKAIVGSERVKSEIGKKIAGKL